MPCVRVGQSIATDRRLQLKSFGEHCTLMVLAACPQNRRVRCGTHFTGLTLLLGGPFVLSPLLCSSLTQLNSWTTYSGNLMVLSSTKGWWISWGQRSELARCVLQGGPVRSATWQARLVLFWRIWICWLLHFTRGWRGLSRDMRPKVFRICWT